jgi:hypothetical protein
MTDAGGIGTAPVWKLPRPWLTAVLVGLGVFAVTAIAIWLLDTSPKRKDAVVAQPTTSVGVRARIVTVAALQSLADARGRPVYWAGERPGTSLEYTQTTDGNVYVRYLTGSAKAGDKRASYVVVATYTQPDAFARVQSIAQRQHLSVKQLPNGAIAVTEPTNARNVHVVFPLEGYQIEIYAPTAVEARRIVRSGAVRRVG